MGQAFLALEALKWWISIINWAPGPPGRLSRPTRPWVGLHTLMTGSVQKDTHVWTPMFEDICVYTSYVQKQMDGSIYCKRQFFFLSDSEVKHLPWFGISTQFKHPQVVIFRFTWRRKRLRGHMEGSSFRWMPEDRHCLSFFIYHTWTIQHILNIRMIYTTHIHIYSYTVSTFSCL